MLLVQYGYIFLVLIFLLLFIIRKKIRTRKIYLILYSVPCDNYYLLLPYNPSTLIFILGKNRCKITNIMQNPKSLKKNYFCFLNVFHMKYFFSSYIWVIVNMLLWAINLMIKLNSEAFHLIIYLLFLSSRFDCHSS